MSVDVIEISSMKKRFQEILNLVDKAIEFHIPLQVPKRALNQKNNNIKFLKWLQKHKIIELKIKEKFKTKKKSIRSRKRKIEIALQLKSFGFTISDIAEKFNVKPNTVKGYFRTLGKYDRNYLGILKLILKIKGINKNLEIIDFLEFPIRIEMDRIKSNLSMLDYKNLEKIIKNNLWIKPVVGQKLGTMNLSILLPEKYNE